MNENREHKELSTQDSADLAELPVVQIMSKLSRSEAGLSQDEAEWRLDQFGYNELTEKEVHPLRKFFTNFRGPIPWMIETAVILSAIVRDWTGFIIILILLILNAVVSFWEEYQAGNTIEALKKKLAPKILGLSWWPCIAAYS